MERAKWYSAVALSALIAAMFISGCDLFTPQAAATFKVTYSANGGSGPVPSDTTEYEQGASVTVRGEATEFPDLKKAGYSLDGWNTKSDGSGTSYAANGTFLMPAGDLKLYAQWVPRMALNPDPPEAGAACTAAKTQAETPAFYGWYLFDAAFVTNGEINTEDPADWAAASIPQYESTINLPSDATDKYLYVKAGRDAAHGYTSLQASAVVQVVAGSGPPVVTSLTLNPLAPLAGQTVTAVYTGSETPAQYGWYLVPANLVDTSGSAPAWAAGAEWWTYPIADWDNSVALPADAAGKYLYGAAIRGADQGYSTIVGSAITRVQ